MKRKRRPDSFRVSRRTRGFLRGRSSPPDRLQQRRNRYPLFFAKLFFLPKKKRSEGEVVACYRSRVQAECVP